MSEGVPRFTWLDWRVAVSDDSGGEKAGPPRGKVNDYLEVLEHHVSTELIVVGSHGGDCASDFDGIVAVKMAEAECLRAEVECCTGVDTILEVTFESWVMLMQLGNMVLAVSKELGVVVCKASFGGRYISI